MNTRTGTLAVLAAALACAAPATAAPTKLKVRVEGATKTLLERTLTTDGHAVDGGDGTGPHKCDGTNGGAGTKSGPTPTSALDTALKRAGLTFSASFDSSFDDFIVNRIGPDASTSSKFWGVALRGVSLQVGGCQALVRNKNEVLWAYDMFSKKHLLRARGASRVRAGHLYKVRVVDTDHKGAAVKGATIGGKKTDANGFAELRFAKPGVKRLKARKADSIRSNQLVVKVLAAK
jgi:hypothetical protein